MAEHAFTFGAKPCLIKTYVQVEIGGEPGYVAFTFVVEDRGHTLRPLADRDGQTLNFFGQTEQDAVTQAAARLEQRFGPPGGAPTYPRVASIRHVQIPELIDDQQTTMIVLARETIRAGDYVVVIDRAATPLTQTSWPRRGAILGRALEEIDRGQHGRVRNVSPGTNADRTSQTTNDAIQRTWAALQRYTGWLKRDRTSAGIRAAVGALGIVLDRHDASEATAAAIAKVSSEIERLSPADLKQLFRNALHDLRLILEAPKGE